MRIVLLTHGGADLVIERLTALPEVRLVRVFIELATAPRRSKMEKLKRSLKYDGFAGTVHKFFPRSGKNGSTGALDRTREAASRCGVPISEVTNFHTTECIEMLRTADADLGVIYGTNIIKETVFSIPRMGSINLHQGLAPYYRGGPPIFWELFNGEKEIGITAHFVAPKVDTGDIVVQKKVPLQYDPSFGLDFEAFIDQRRAAMREDSAEIVAEAVSAIASGNFPRSPQDTSIGKRYRLPTKREKDELRRRLKKRLAGGDV